MEKKFRDEGIKSSITEHRIRALEGIGFNWAKRKGDHSWNTKYQELLEYKALHSTADIPTKYDGNRALGRWVSTQRAQYKMWMAGHPSHMNQRRYDLLVEAGFSFDMLSSPQPKKNQKKLLQLQPPAKDDSASNVGCASTDEKSLPAAKVENPKATSSTKDGGLKPSQFAMI